MPCPAATAHPRSWAAAPETPALQVGTGHLVPCRNTHEYGKFHPKTPPDPQPPYTEHTESVQTALEERLAASGNDPPIAAAEHQACMAVLAVTQGWGY